jgi:hypothetical protein
MVEGRVESSAKCGAVRLIQGSINDLVGRQLSCNDQSSIKIAE